MVANRAKILGKTGRYLLCRRSWGAGRTIGTIGRYRQRRGNDADPTGMNVAEGEYELASQRKKASQAIPPPLDLNHLMGRGP